MTTVKTKKRIAAAAIAAAILLSAFITSAGAAQIVCFTGVNDTLMPLRDATMPAYFGTTLYVPSGVFTAAGLSVSLSASRGNLYVHKGKLRLNFFIELGAVTDQDGVVYEDVPIKRQNGLYFLPIEFVCDYFKLTYSIIPSDPISILRVKSSDAVYNDKTFAGHFKKQMETYYSEYLASKATARPTATPGTGAPATATPPVYAGATVYISFFGVTEEFAPRVLDALRLGSVRACFFMSERELAAYPALARRIFGEGHSLGVWLETDDAEEYARARALLFEAAKARSPLVASPTETAETARALCAELGLIYRAASVYAAGVTDAGSLLPSSRYSVTDVRFECSDDALRLLPSALSAFTEAGISPKAITETSADIS
ncbi:MAG: polysaccharide deacetylase family protein [Oscillospiraceae bacterium]|jgi:hypothetical protein|nr:polysaccharide deacetylase family protein [Oscillospiraceae bacterium]